MSRAEWLDGGKLRHKFAVPTAADRLVLRDGRIMRHHHAGQLLRYLDERRDLLPKSMRADGGSLLRHLSVWGAA